MANERNIRMIPAADTLRGIYRDCLIHANGETVATDWRPNTIVRNCRVLLAGCLRGDFPEIKLELSVGRGRDDWDENEPGKAAESVQGLEQAHTPALGRESLQIDYLDEGTQSDVPQPALQIIATLPPGYPPALPDLDSYPLREFGVFGAVTQNAGTATEKTLRYMVNCIRHPVIHKNAAATLIREVRIFL